jgi:hypothetical protein
MQVAGHCDIGSSNGRMHGSEFVVQVMLYIAKCLDEPTMISKQNAPRYGIGIRPEIMLHN